MTNRGDRWMSHRLRRYGAGIAVVTVVPRAWGMENDAGDWGWQDMANDDA